MHKSIYGIFLGAYYRNDQLWLTLKNKYNQKEDFLVDFNPYFYISFFDSEKSFLSKQIKELTSISQIIKITKVNKANIQDIYKLEFKSVNDLIEIRNLLQKQEFNIEKYTLHEYDIALIYRYFVDHSLSNFRNVILTLNSGKVIDIKCDGRVDWKNLNIGCFDIEVLVNEDLKFPEMGVNPIISISYTNNKNKKEVFFLVNSKDSDLDVIEEKLSDYLDSNSINLNLFNYEKELLIKFKEFIEKEDPDILYTYNGIFDLEYISKSYKRLTKEELTINSRHIIFNKSKNKKVQIEGIIHFDVYRLIKLLNYFQVFNYSKFDLNTLYYNITGNEKVTCPPKEMRVKYLSEDYQSIINYNLDDCLATSYLAENYVGFVEEMAQFLNTPLIDILYSPASGMVEKLFIKDYFEHNKIIPNRPNKELITQRYRSSFTGAFVYQPSSGLYNDLAVLDFRSYHISLLISYNISPETIDIDCINYNEILGHKICKDFPGFVPILLKNLLSIRMKFKEDMQTKDSDSIEHKSLYSKQYAIKILLASTYGYMGFAGSRWYCSTCLKVMYYLVRTKIKELIKKFEDFGYHVVYGDTDSCFIKFENITKLDADVKKINADLPLDMHLELENIFKSAIFVKSRGGEKAAKKKYAMLDYTGNLKIKGFEYVRRDWCLFVKNTQKKVLELVLNSKDFKLAIDFVKSKILDLQNRNVSNDELVIQSIIHKKISNYKTSNPAVEAVEHAQKEGYTYKNGDLVEYIITNKNTKSISSKAVIKELVSEKDYDVNYYLQNQLVPAIHPILEVFGVTKDELLHNKKQRGIKDFF